MNTLLRKFYIVSALLCLFSQVCFSQDEFQIIESRINQYLREEGNVAKLDKEVKKNILSLQSNGSWQAIDYASTAGTNWNPLLHLTRVKQFSLMLAANEQTGSMRNTLAGQTISALRFWLTADPKSTNWFQNEIASPTGIGEILILLKHTKILPSGLQDSLLKRMNRGDVVHAVGANKLDIAIHMMYSACVQEDKELMDSAVTQAFMPISLTYKNGLQSDYSYLQHGPQLQIASYGQVFLIGEYKVASWLLGTSFELPSQKLKILDHYLVNTYLKTIRGRYIDFNTEGRGISRNDVLDKLGISGAKSDHDLLALAKKVTKENIILLEQAQQRISQKQTPSFKIMPLHSHFWKADYSIHLRPTYSFNVRTVSKRTVRTETGNKENLLAKFLPDGSTNIQRSGSEYFNIMPIWEWDKIPGVTNRDYPTDPKMTIEWGERGVSSFVGGVSDGIYGITTYQLDYDEVKAKKAWFFFDDEIVCLGADINSFAKEPITTTINQAWRNGLVKAFVNGKLVAVDKKLISTEVDWVLHDSIGYYFPNKGKLQLSNGLQTGSWARINANRSPDKVTGEVFKLWLDHGLNPVMQSYAYIVKPGVNLENMLSTQKIKSEILVNNEIVQAVKNENLQMLQIVFYDAGVLKAGKISVAVDRACVLLIKDVNSKQPIIYLADPTQKLTEIKLTFNNALIKVNEPVILTLPQGSERGSTVSLTLN